MTNDLGLDPLRTVGMRLVASLIVVMAVVTGLLVLVLETPGKWPAAVLAVLLAIYPVVMTLSQRTDAAARMMVSITVVAVPALMLYVTESYFWQTDLHLLFFAMLAAASILCDWKALVAATVVVAVHHLGLGMLMPEWLFAGEGSLARIVLHAAILVVEAGTLIWVALRIVTLVEANEAQTIERERAALALADERTSQTEVMTVLTAQLGQSLTALASGDLTNVIVADFPGGYAVLKTDYNRAVSSLRSAVAAVTESADGIRTGADEIAQASEDLARRTESTAASLEQTSAALVQIESRLKTTAENSAGTVVRADQAIASVGAGRDMAQGARQAMARVSQSAKGIDSVIEGVDKIAFQTRVLAMNAAVEAGRAGDAGRGFAVVADLVSALALRAEAEAKRARDQLTVTQAEIVTAVAAVEHVDRAFADITDDVDAVHGLLSEMATDNRAQSGVICEISAAVGTMDRATQQNAAMVEETSAAARNLTAEVATLTLQTAKFQVTALLPGVRTMAPRFADAPARWASVQR